MKGVGVVPSMAIFGEIEAVCRVFPLALSRRRFIVAERAAAGALRSAPARVIYIIKYPSSFILFERRRPRHPRVIKATSLKASEPS